MKNKLKASLILTTLIICSNILAQNDTTVYLKTQFQHILVDSRNSGKRFVVMQEMRNSKNQVFREVYYNKVSKELDYILYYYYNNNNTIRLITKNKEDESIYEYDKYIYKKKKLIGIEHYNYNAESKSSQLVSIEKIKFKKGVKTIQHTNSNEHVISTTRIEYEGDLEVSNEKTSYYTDSIIISKKTIDYDVSNNIEVKHCLRIKNNTDTISLTHNYFYKENGNLDRIDSYKNNKIEYYTQYKYDSKGMLTSKYVKFSGNQNLFKEISYFTYTKHYYNKLPINPTPF